MKAGPLSVDRAVACGQDTAVLRSPQGADVGSGRQPQAIACLGDISFTGE